MKRGLEHTLEFLLAFDGRRHWYPSGYYVKFAIRRVPPTRERPHGLRYSFTLHDPEDKRLIGFDNAHIVTATGTRFKPRPVTADHWHRTESDPGRPYAFKDAETLTEDFFAEVERVLTERGIPVVVVDDSGKDGRKQP
ncbi:MAG: DUF6516 family protein [Nitrococcus sp.]|nr:DUF6516 family protein [Nitrococcus sp.]